MRVEKIYFYISKALFATTCVCTFTFTKDKGKVCFQPNIWRVYLMLLKYIGDTFISKIKKKQDFNKIAILKK